MDLSELDKSVINTIDSIKYKSKTKTLKVSDKITIDWEGVLPEPPANTSEETKKELGYLHLLTNNLTPENRGLVKLVDKEPLDLYKPIFEKMGKRLPLKEFKKANMLVSSISIWT